MKCLEKILTKAGWVESDDFEVYKPLTKPDTRIKLYGDSIIKDYSEIERLVDKTLSRIVRFSKEDIAFKVLEPYSFDKLAKKYKLDTETGFILTGPFYKLRYGKLHNIFLKENPLWKILDAAFHEIGHALYWRNPNYSRKITELYALSFELYSLETFDTLNYDLKYNINLEKTFEKHSDSFELKSLQVLMDKFPNIKDVCLFLDSSTEKEILEKAGPIKKLSIWERIKNF